MENEIPDGIPPEPIDHAADEAERARKRAELKAKRMEWLRRGREKRKENRAAQVVHNHLKLVRKPDNPAKSWRKVKGVRDVNDFLYPPMPGAFLPSEMRKRQDEDRIKRYLKTFSATMGNHSISLYYAAWTQADFVDALNNYPDFGPMIDEEKNRLADRAQFMLLKTMGLIPNAGELDDTHKANAAALAKVVEKINEGRTDTRASKGVALRVDGLERPKRDTP